MSLEMKKFIVDKLTEAGSLEYTKSVLLQLREDLRREFHASELQAGTKNWILRLMLYRMK